MQFSHSVCIFIKYIADEKIFYLIQGLPVAQRLPKCVGITWKYHTKLKKLARDKRSSLFLSASVSKRKKLDDINIRFQHTQEMDSKNILFDARQTL